MGLRTLAEPEANTKPSGGLPLELQGRSTCAVSSCPRPASRHGTGAFRRAPVGLRRAKRRERRRASKQAGRHRGADGVPGFLPETPAKTAWKSRSGRGPRVSSACSRVWCRHDSGAIASSASLARNRGRGRESELVSRELGTEFLRPGRRKIRGRGDAPLFGN
jgi:hypothetical protein